MRGPVPEGIPTPRILTLSDLIFGLALSISALTLIGHQPATADQLVAALALYGFSFLILITVWRVYSAITSILPHETRLLNGLTYVLLFLVSVEPYLFNELFAPLTFGDFVSDLYAVDLGFMFLILAAFNHVLANEERNLVAKPRLGRYRWARNVCLGAAVVFFVSTVPPLGSTMVVSYVSGGVIYQISVRSLLWIASLFLGLVRHAFER